MDRGPHVLRGIEVYKGKPIFYSLGNFFFQYESGPQVPPEALAFEGLDPSTLDTWRYNRKITYWKERRFWQSVVPRLTWAGERLAEVELHPIALGFGGPVDTPGIEQSPAVAADGTLYFAANRAGGKGSLDLWRARPVGDRYAEPENLAAINSEANEGSPAIAPDQSFLVFAAAGRPDALLGGGFPYPRSDLYVSFRRGDGWTAPRSLGSPINTAANESAPALSPDGKWLYFTSERSFATAGRENLRAWSPAAPRGRRVDLPRLCRARHSRGKVTCLQALLRRL